MSAPLSYANHANNLEKNPSMPLQAKAAGSKKGNSGANNSNSNNNAAAVAPAATQAAASSSPASPPTEKKPKAEKPAKASPPAAATQAAAAAPASASSASARPAAPAKVAAPKKAEPVPASSDDDKKEPRAPATHYKGYAMVKAVLSGDTLVLAGAASGGINTPERTISLSGVLAPKFGRGKAQTDEPFAWESREYLRKHVIGQQVHFVVQHTNESSGRDFGVVEIDTPSGKLDIATQMIRAGWVRVKQSPGQKDGKAPPPEKEALLAIEAEAAARKLGLHRQNTKPEDHVRNIDWTPDAQSLFNENKGKPLPGVVDMVRDGSTLRIELIHPSNPMRHSVITLLLSGVSCPRTPLPLSVLQERHDRKKAEDPSYKGTAPRKEKPEPFAMEALAFTEARLLNRDVQVVLQGVDKTGNLFGSIVFAKGNISAKLLEKGLGKFVPWSAALTSNVNELKAAEAAAKQQRVGIWKNWNGEDAVSSSPNGSPAPASSEFQGKVVSVPTGDSIVVEDPSGKEIRVWLASVRAPRLANKGRDKDEAYAQEAKEFLRSKLVGQRIRVVPEYVIPSDSDLPPRQCVTVWQGKVNVNEALISSGYAEAIQHGRDEDRSSQYDVLLSAESKAKEAQRGVHNPKEHIVQRITDLTERARLPRKKKAKAPAAASASPASGEDGNEGDAEEEKEDGAAASSSKAAQPSKAEVEAQAKTKQLVAKAKQYLVLLQREKQINGVVEFVFSPSKFKILVSKEHVMIALSLAGIRTPMNRTSEGKLDPLSEEVLQYVRARVNQHGVKIEVEGIDKAGNFLGSLFHNRTNLAVDLLQQGYASVFPFSAAKSPYARELYAAEKAAKDAKRGLWVNYVEPTPEERAAAGNDDTDAVEDKTAGSSRTVRITEIVDCGDFWVQYVGDKNAEAVAAALQTISEQAESDEPFNPPANANGRPFMAAGQFSDDKWYRVRCDGVDANGDWNVFFVDFGNYDTLIGDRLRHLPSEASKIPPLATHCALAGLTPPRGADYLENSALAFSQLAFGLDLHAAIEFTDKFGRKHLTLTHDSLPTSVNKLMLKDGHAKIQTRPDRRIQKLVSELQEAQDEAKRFHRGVFEYGDVSDEEEGGDRVRGPDPTRPRPGARK